MKIKHNYLISVVLAFTVFSCENSDDVTNEEKTSRTGTVNAIGEISNLNNELMLKLVNGVRASGCECRDKEGNITKMPPASPLEWNDKLTLAAKKHSEDMALNNYFSHDNLKNETVGDRVTLVGYKWSAAAENIARGQKTEKEVFDGWLNSYGHCKNIINSTVKEMGVARSAGDTPYWTQVFASK